MEQQTGTNHKLLLNNRTIGSFTGIIDVVSFDLSEIHLETEMGALRIKGKNLHVNRVNLDKGEVDIEGTVDCLEYSQSAKMKRSSKDSIFGKLFA